MPPPSSAPPPARRIDATDVGVSRTPFRTLPREMHNMMLSLLSAADIARLSCTCWFWHEFATPIAYARNARDDNSSAIEWAAASRSRDASDQGVQAAVIRRSVENGGDVNAAFGSHDGRNDSWGRALHLAAAGGKDRVVRELLQAGASVSARCSGHRFFACRGLLDHAALRAFAPGLRDALHRSRWLPALLPVLYRHSRVVRRLFSHGAPMKLAVGDRDPLTPAPKRRTISLFHVFAAMSEDRLALDAELFQDALQNPEGWALIDVGLPGVGWAPLHLTLSSGNSVMLEQLLRLGARVDIESDVGRTPLNYAVWLCGCAGQSLEQRKTLVRLVKTLLEHGANPNHCTDRVVDETPLICTVRSGSDEGGGVTCEMMDVAKLLVSRGADVNLKSPQGLTVVHRLCLAILQRGGKKSLDKYLEYLISVKADVNLPMATTRRTVLHELLRSTVPGNFKTRCLLVDKGATIMPHEADDVLRLWMQTPRLRGSRGYNALKHKEHLSQGAVNDAYLHAVSTQDRSLFEILMAENLRPTNASQLVGITAKVVNHKLWPLVRRMAFDPNWADDVGRTYLHMVVMKLVGGNGYRESTAVHDAAFFISRGTSVLVRDASGLTALQQLQRLRANRHFGDLRLMLFEARDRETGQS